MQVGVVHAQQTKYKLFNHPFKTQLLHLCRQYECKLFERASKNVSYLVEGGAAAILVGNPNSIKSIIISYNEEKSVIPMKDIYIQLDRLFGVQRNWFNYCVNGDEPGASPSVISEGIKFSCVIFPNTFGQTRFLNVTIK